MEEKEYYEIFEFDNKIVKTIINLCYGVTPKTPLIIEEYAQLLSFAIKYEMEYIKSVIKASIVLTPQNICEYSNLAVKHGCIEFFDECFDYLIICLQYSYPIKNFDALNADIKDLLAERID
uniref:BTB domain-containing protein n=1 Tax=Panagrolaimus superbus TaxID=310955 RepID=A0A914ZDH8_9BILA